MVDPTKEEIGRKYINDKLDTISNLEFFTSKVQTLNTKKSENLPNHSELKQLLKSGKIDQIEHDKLHHLLWLSWEYELLVYGYDINAF